MGIQHREPQSQVETKDDKRKLIVTSLYELLGERFKDATNHTEDVEAQVRSTWRKKFQVQSPAPNFHLLLRRLQNTSPVPDKNISGDIKLRIQSEEMQKAESKKIKDSRKQKNTGKLISQ